MNDGVDIMEPFRYTTRVSFGTGRQDKIEMVLDGWRVSGVEQYVTYFFNFLGGDPYSDRSDGLTSGSDPDGSRRIFCRGSGNLRSRINMSIQTGGRGSGRRIGAPLYAGELIALRRGRETQFGPSPHMRQLSLKLSINPTRYVAHQRLPPYDQFADPGGWGVPSLVTRRRDLRTRIEASLDANDNILLSQRVQAFARPENWPLHVRRYWNALTQQLHDEFQRAADAADVELVLEERLNLLYVETYWEFSVEDATAFVHEISPILAALGIEASVRRFPYSGGLGENSYVGNCVAVNSLLATGVFLSVYAKTTKRVRFEVRHDLRKNSSPLGGRHTTTPGEGWQTLHRWLEQLEEDAALRLNRVLLLLAQQMLRPVTALRPYHFVHRVIRACPDASIAEDVLSLLVNNPCIRIRPNDPHRAAVAALVRAGILERLGSTRNPARYVIVPEFRMAAAELRGIRED